MIIKTGDTQIIGVVDDEKLDDTTTKQALEKAKSNKSDDNNIDHEKEGLN